MQDSCSWQIYEKLLASEYAGSASRQCSQSHLIMYFTATVELTRHWPGLQQALQFANMDNSNNLTFWEIWVDLFCKAFLRMRSAYFLYNFSLYQFLKMKRKEIVKKTQPSPSKNLLSPGPVKSPKQGERTSQAKKQKGTPLMALDGSQEDISSQQKEQFLMLQIKQLRRENNFLKKKISQLTIQFGPDRPQRKGGKEKQKGATLLSQLQIMPLSVNLFFQEIHNLLGTIIKLFRIDFTQEEILAHHQRYNQEILETCPIKKHALLKKYYLKRKLQRVMLQTQQKRFPQFLELFTEYYQFKQESQNKIITTVDAMTLRAHELNELLIKKVQDKKKSRSTFSMLRPNEEIQIEPLKVPVSPKNHVVNNKLSTYSPANGNKKKAPKFALSPAERIKKTQ